MKVVKKGKEQQADQAEGKQPPASGKAGGQHRTVDDIQHTTEDGVTPASAGKKPMVVLTQSRVTPNGAAQWKANLMPNPDSGILNKTLNGGSVSPMRARKRNATTSDQDSLEKATKLKARKNLDSSSSKGNKPQTSSFNTFDDPTLLAAASSLGLVLGSNEQEVSNSLNSLRDLVGKRLSESKLLVNHNVANVDETTSIFFG
jgi:hypothetical protein